MPEQARVPVMLFDLSWVLPGPLLFTVTFPTTMLLLNVSAKLPIRFTSPAKRFPVHPDLEVAPDDDRYVCIEHAEGLVGRGP